MNETLVPEGSTLPVIRTTNMIISETLLWSIVEMFDKIISKLSAHKPLWRGGADYLTPALVLRSRNGGTNDIRSYWENRPH